MAVGLGSSEIGLSGGARKLTKESSLSSGSDSSSVVVRDNPKSYLQLSQTVGSYAVDRSRPVS